MARIALRVPADELVLEVEVESTSGRSRESYRYRIGETSGEVEVERTGPGEGWIRLGASIVPYYAVRKNGRIQAWVGGRTYTFELIDGSPRRTEAGGERKGPKSDRVTAPMPGTVLKILSCAGDSFDAHQPLVIMESMKMELTLSVPHAGCVKEIYCREGQLVEMGAVLVRLDGAS